MGNKCNYNKYFNSDIDEPIPPYPHEDNNIIPSNPPPPPPPLL